MTYRKLANINYKNDAQLKRLKLEQKGWEANGLLRNEQIALLNAEIARLKKLPKETIKIVEKIVKEKGETKINTIEVIKEKVIKIKGRTITKTVQVEKIIDNNNKLLLGTTIFSVVILFLFLSVLIFAKQKEISGFLKNVFEKIREKIINFFDGTKMFFCLIGLKLKQWFLTATFYIKQFAQQTSAKIKLFVKKIINKIKRK